MSRLLLEYQTTMSRHPMTWFIPHFRIAGLPETDPVTSKAERPLVRPLYDIVENHCAIGLLDEQPERCVLHAHALHANVIGHDMHGGIQGVEASAASVDGQAGERGAVGLHLDGGPLRPTSESPRRADPISRHSS